MLRHGIAEIGAWPEGRRVRFKVWAPFAKTVSVEAASHGPSSPIRLMKDSSGYFHGAASSIKPGDDYYYRLDGRDRYPDPASRFQPAGVHGPSRVVDPLAFRWTDGAWKGLPLERFIIYEIHVGAFSRTGDFCSVASRLNYLRKLGVTAVELMPVGQFPGGRNWGYDGVFPFAPQNTYGGPDGLKLLVNACHGAGLAVILDVVYNHLGPEGNNLGHFGPYFTTRYKTPWGDALNFDGAWSDEVRRFFILNALYWINELRIDALRIDAVEGMLDFSANPFLAELANAVHQDAARFGRQVQVMAESDLNDARIISPRELAGSGLDAQWNDDFHHALHAVITGERQGYYRDFGRLGQLACAFRRGFVFTGQYSKYRRRGHGNSPAGRAPSQFVVFSQNHDQVGNRAAGDRLSVILTFEKLKLAAGAVLLSPFVPLLFMGEEYGEEAPFPFFIDFSDAALVEAIRRGRLKDLKAMGWPEAIPDPQAESTFLSAKLDPGLCRAGRHKVLFDFYRALIALRKRWPVMTELSETGTAVKRADGSVLVVRRRVEEHEILCLFNFDSRRASLTMAPGGAWRKMLDSAARQWRGPGGIAPAFVKPVPSPVRLRLQPWSFVVYGRTGKRGRPLPAEDD